MGKKKQERKEEEKLVVASKQKADDISITFGDIIASLTLEGSRITYIGITRMLPFISNHIGIFEENIEKFIDILRKIVAIYDALNVLHGGSDD